MLIEVRTGLQHLPTRVRVAYGLLGATYLAAALTIVLGCQPMPKYWQINPDPGGRFFFGYLILADKTRHPANDLQIHASRPSRC